MSRNMKIAIPVVALITVLIVGVFTLFITKENYVGNSESVDNQGNEEPTVVQVGLPIGEQKSNLPTVEVFFDYTCYHCAAHEIELGDLFIDGAGEKFNLILHPVISVGQPFNVAATEVLLATQEEFPEYVPDVHKELMRFSMEEQEVNNYGILGNYEKSLAKAKEIAKTTIGKESTVQTSDGELYLQASTDSWVNREDISRESNEIGTPEVIVDGVQNRDYSFLGENF